MTTELEDETNEEIWYEIEYEIDVDEHPSGPYHYGAGSYGIGCVGKVTRARETPDGVERVVLDNLEESDPELWRRIQRHVDMCVDSLGDNE